MSNLLSFLGCRSLFWRALSCRSRRRQRGRSPPPLFSFSYMPFLESYSSDLERATRAACQMERCGVRFRITQRRVGCADFAREIRESKINTDRLSFALPPNRARLLDRWTAQHRTTRWPDRIPMISSASRSLQAQDERAWPADAPFILPLVRQTSMDDAFLQPYALDDSSQTGGRNRSAILLGSRSVGR